MDFSHCSTKYSYCRFSKELSFQRLPPLMGNAPPLEGPVLTAPVPLLCLLFPQKLSCANRRQPSESQYGLVVRSLCSEVSLLDFDK